jgi:hypothetical protein
MRGTDCPNPLHDHPQRAGSGEPYVTFARRRESAGWLKRPCPECGVHGWTPPQGTAAARPVHDMPGPGEQPVGDCDVCGNPFEPGQWWIYHARLQVYVHSICAATSLVRGEDITSHTVLMGHVPMTDPEELTG